jgi:hypothetical protein
LWNIKINWCENIDSSINFIQKREEKNEGRCEIAMYMSLL